MSSVVKLGGRHQKEFMELDRTDNPNGVRNGCFTIIEDEKKDEEKEEDGEEGEKVFILVFSLSNSIVYSFKENTKSTLQELKIAYRRRTVKQVFRSGVQYENNTWAINLFEKMFHSSQQHF